jgi:hypothetical protein
LIQKVDKWRDQGLVEKSPTQNPPSASGGLKLILTRPSFVPGAETQETDTALYSDVFASLRCPMVNGIVALFLFASPSPKSIISKASIPIRLLKRMILIFQMIVDRELLDPQLMEQWPQFVKRLPSLPGRLDIPVASVTAPPFRSFVSQLL